MEFKQNLLCGERKYHEEIRKTVRDKIVRNLATRTWTAWRASAKSLAF